MCQVPVFGRVVKPLSQNTRPASNSTTTRTHSDLATSSPSPDQRPTSRNATQSPPSHQSTASAHHVSTWRPHCTTNQSNRQSSHSSRQSPNHQHDSCGDHSGRQPQQEQQPQTTSCCFRHVRLWTFVRFPSVHFSPYDHFLQSTPPGTPAKTLSHNSTPNIWISVAVSIALSALNINTSES